MLKISFNPEAGDSYERVIGEMTGWVVCITPEAEHDPANPVCPLPDPKPFDAVLLGTDHEAGWYGAVRVKLFNEEIGEGIGEPFTVVADEIHVY